MKGIYIYSGRPTRLEQGMEKVLNITLQMALDTLDIDHPKIVCNELKY